MWNKEEIVSQQDCTTCACRFCPPTGGGGTSAATSSLLGQRQHCPASLLQTCSPSATRRDSGWRQGRGTTRERAWFSGQQCIRGHDIWHSSSWPHLKGLQSGSDHCLPHWGLQPRGMHNLLQWIQGCCSVAVTVMCVHC